MSRDLSSVMLPKFANTYAFTAASQVSAGTVIDCAGFREAHVIIVTGLIGGTTGVVQSAFQMGPASDAVTEALPGAVFELQANQSIYKVFEARINIDKADRFIRCDLATPVGSNFSGQVSVIVCLGDPSRSLGIDDHEAFLFDT